MLEEQTTTEDDILGFDSDELDQEVDQAEQQDQSGYSVDQSEIGKAFAAQRQALQAEYEAKLELERERIRQELLGSQQYDQESSYDEPDPVIDPGAWKDYHEERNRTWQTEMEIRMARFIADQSISAMQSQIDAMSQQSGYGWNDVIDRAWQNISLNAQLMGVDPQAVVDNILLQPNAGQRIFELATKFGQPQAQQPQQQAQQQVTVQPRQQNPYNLAVPTVGNLPGQVVADSRQPTEEEILGQ